MISELIEKITFLLDNNLESITLVLSILLGSTIAIPNAITPPSPNVIPISPVSVTALATFGSLIRTTILMAITLSLCYLISRMSFARKWKVRLSSYFYNKFGCTTYGLYSKNHASVIVLFLSSIPSLNPIVSSITGFVLRVDIGRNIYLNIIGLVIYNMLITLLSFGGVGKLISITLIASAVLIAGGLIILPYMRLEKKIK